MRRRLVDGIWIRQRMDANDLRHERALREREQQRRLPRLAPEIVPFVEITIVPAADRAPWAPVVDVTIDPKGGGR